MSFVLSYEDFLNEAIVTVKRKYTENHPAKIVSDYAPVREKILAFVQEKGEVTLDELKEFISLLNEESGGKTSAKWLTKNSKYFKVKEGKYALSHLGKRVHDSINKS
jgi:hypothetical protein